MNAHVPQGRPKSAIHEPGARSKAAYRRRYGNDYDEMSDDTGWWKWLLGWEAGYEAGLRSARRGK